MEPVREVKLKWSDIEALCLDVAKQLRGKYEVVVPISRGGLCPGTIIANILGISNIRPIRWQTREGDAKDRSILQEIIQTYERILIIDDILDSGKCLSEMSEVIRGAKNPATNVTFGVLLKNVSYEYHADEMYNLVFGQRYDKRTDDRWIVFPWEDVKLS